MHNCERFGQLQAVRATETLQNSHRPHMGRWLTCPNRLSSFISDDIWFLSGICTCQPRLQTSNLKNLLTCLPRLMLAQLRPTLRSTTVCTCCRDLKFSHRPHGRPTFCSFPCLQGGGVRVQSGTVTITSSSIYGNTATNVRAYVQHFPSSRWEHG